jgi:hypothetical protein
MMVFAVWKAQYRCVVCRAQCRPGRKFFAPSQPPIARIAAGGTDELRNLFDQYSQAENRVTHALLSALNEDRRLLRLFLRDLVKATPAVDTWKLAVLEQQYPGEEEPSEEELDRRGIPDGWIVAEEQAWCVLIESKVLASLRGAQIESHRRTAARRGFTTVIAVAITAHRPAAAPQRTVMLEWRDIYAWLRHHRAGSVWAGRAADYLEIAEAKLIEAGQFVEGTLTMFSGFPFDRDHPYTYLEGKRVLGLALGELRARQDLRQRLGMNPKVPGRPAITGQGGDVVWNFLSLSSASDAGNHTRYPHLTLAIAAWGVDAMVTVPNAQNAAAYQDAGFVQSLTLTPLSSLISGRLERRRRDQSRNCAGSKRDTARSSRKKNLTMKSSSAPSFRMSGAQSCVTPVQPI